MDDFETHSTNHAKCVAVRLRKILQCADPERGTVEF